MISSNQPWQAVTATDAAVQHIVQQINLDPKAIGFRLEVKRTGCSGWQYVVGLVYEPKNDDHVITVDQGQLDIYIDPKSLEMVQGTKIDFISKGLTRQLLFNNPNVKSECGCGESFSV